MNPPSSMTQLYRIFIKATPQAVWDAITTSESTRRYGYGTPVDYDLRAGGHYRHYANEFMRSMGVPEIAVDGEVLQVDAPHKLVQTWRACWQPDEPATRLTFEIADRGNGVTELTVIHELEGAPQVAEMVGGRAEGSGGGWWRMLSDVKSLLETGSPLAG